MIDEVHVHDVALIHDATIQPSEGLTVLTGETGTGKSALLSAFKLLVGDRAEASSVREGAPALEVEGRFFVGDGSEDGHVVRRRVSADGRGRVEIDGHMASVRELASTLGATVDLCGQHEHQRLLDVSTHVALLDAFAAQDVQPALAAYREALAAARQAQHELEHVQEAGRTSEQRLDEAAFVLRQIDAVDPSAEEYQQLQEDLPRAEHAESLMRAADAAHEAIAGDGGVSDVLSEAIAGLRDAAVHDPRLGGYADALESALIEAEDVASDLRDYRDDVDLDPESLQQMQERDAQYQRLLRSYGPSMEALLDRRDEAREVVSAAQDGGERERRARKAVEEAEAVLAQAADALDTARSAAAPALGEAITHEMASLEMGSAQVDVSMRRLPRAQWGDDGPSHVELMYRPGAGLSLRPLRKIASGGEVSRVMLACKVVLGEADDIDTLVFDEVDAGVGGATAVALAAVLARLARTHQVIVVTHLAQVAVMADRHYLVSKTDADVPETSIREAEGEERVREIARMLSGDQTQASLDHAREMLERAGR